MTSGEAIEIFLLGWGWAYCCEFIVLIVRKYAASDEAQKKEEK